MAAVVPAALVNASAAFDPETATGFVGKGEVQTPWGLNNQTFQNEAHNVAHGFSYVTVDTYSVTTVWATGNPANPWTLDTQIHPVTTTAAVDAAVAGDPRQLKGQKQFTGFNLTGYGSAVVDGTIPVPDAIEWIVHEWDAETNKQGKVTREAGSSDAMPSYTDSLGNTVLYSQRNKAILSVEKISSVGGLCASDSSSGTGPTQIWPPPPAP